MVGVSLLYMIIYDYICSPSTRDCDFNKTCKINKYLDIKSCSCEKNLFDKLILTCEDEILSTTETSLDNKIAICENNCALLTLVFAC